MAHWLTDEDVDVDEKFEQFLKESLSDDSFGNEPKEKSRIPESVDQARKKKASGPWWITEDDSEDVPSKSKFVKQGNEKKLTGSKDAMPEDNERRMSFSNNEPGIHGISSSFLKSRRLSPSIVEVDEDDAESIQLPQPNRASVSLSKDSLEPNDSVVALGPSENILGAGLDTLEEEEEKKKFFADLERGASSTMDYSKLNMELDSNDSEILQTFLRSHPQVKQMKENNSEPETQEKSGDYSEDFEENSDYIEDNKVEQVVISEATEARTGMLAKVLLDSQDSALETPKASDQQDIVAIEHHVAQDVPAEEMNGTGISTGQTNSDMEALHQAYRHIEQSLGDTDEQKIHADKMELEDSLVRDTSQSKENCPQNTSITNSDLATIEELMKPIRADSSFIRGFELEPVSSVKVSQDNKDELMRPSKEHQNDIPAEPQNVGCLLDHPNEQENVSILAVANEDDENSPQPKASKDKLTDKIKHHAVRQTTASNCSTLYQESTPGQILQSNTWDKENPNSLINKQVMYKNTKSTSVIRGKKLLSGPHCSVRSSGYGKSNSSLKHFSTVNEKTLKENIKKPLLKVKSPPKQKGTSVTKIIQTKSHSVSPKQNDSTVPGHLSTTRFPQEAKESDCCIQTLNISSNSSLHGGRELYLLKNVQEAEKKLTEAHDLISSLKTTFLQKEKEMETKILELKVQQEKELSQLSQENYVLHAQQNNKEDLKKGTKWLSIQEKNPNNEEMLKEIQKEVQDQEILLQGYHQENERLYKQVKELQLNNKKNEENMFKENQRLMTQLASLQEKLEKNNILSCGVPNTKPSENQNFTDLISELHVAKAKESNFLEERKHLKQDKQALEVDLAQVKKERDLARAQLASISDEKSYEMKIMEQPYKDEINRLQKRLKWYAENQELLDKDAARLRGAKEEVDKLKVEVAKLRREAGNQSAQQKLRLKSRAADAKRIQDLERQVKEMEGILKRRYPNSLPALIYAAATAASEGDGVASAKSNTVDFLERRVKKLETDLEGKDDEAKKSLRAMEQQFQKIKLQYEKRIGELEELLAYKLRNEPQKPQELCGMREAHQATIDSLQAEINSLRSHIAQLEQQRKPRDDEADLQSLEYQVEQAHAKARLVRLSQEMMAKNREIQDLTKTVEKLQKERRIMLSNTNSSQVADKRGKSSGALEAGCIGTEKKDPRNEGVFPDALKNKIYHPNAFADSHISEVQQENAQLKQDLEKLRLELSQERMTSQAALTNSENLLRRTKEELEEHIVSLKAAHQKELEKILCQQATEYSTSKAAELHSKISSQETLIKYLQQQVGQLQQNEGALAVSQRREAVLQKEMAKLLEELRESRECQSPGMKHFVCLEKKIKQLEASYEQREQELQQVIQQTQNTAEVEQILETEKWKKLALLKNQELEKFRIELDSMLDVLRQLQKQGVVLSVGSSNMPENYWKI